MWVQPWLSWEIGASLGSSKPEVKPRPAFSGSRRRRDLPRFGLIVVLVVLVVFVVVEVFVLVDVLVVFVDIVFAVLNVEGERKDGDHEAGSDVGFGLSRFGGGYVDQKWRPHFGHTQN